MEKIIKPVKISRSNFSSYGDLISTDDINPMNINEGYAKRFDNLANLDTSKDSGKTIVSIFSALKRTFPMKIHMMEKHPLSTQAFIPIGLIESEEIRSPYVAKLSLVIPVGLIIFFIIQPFQRL